MSHYWYATTDPIRSYGVLQLTRSFGVLLSYDAFLYGPIAYFIDVPADGDLVAVLVHLVVSADVYF